MTGSGEDALASLVTGQSSEQPLATPREIAEVAWLAWRWRAARLVGSERPCDPEPAAIASDAPAPTPSPDADSQPELPLEISIGAQERTSTASVPSTSIATQLIAVQALPALERPLEHARGFHQLGTLCPEPGACDVDVGATVERTAALGAPTLVFRPRLRRSTQLLLLIDRAGQIAPWRRTLDQLVRVARSTGAFRSVDALHVDLSARAEVRFHAGANGAVVDPAQLARSSDLVVLLLSDGVGPALASGALGASLRRLPVGTRVAWVHLWDREHWWRTAAVRLRPAIPASLGPKTDALGVPILPLDPRALGGLASWVRGRDSRLQAVGLPTRPRLEAIAASRRAGRSVHATVEWAERIAGTVRPETLRLLALAAAVPGRVDVDLLLALGRALAPRSATRFHLGEALASGAFERVDAEDDRVLVRFVSDEVRASLRQYLPAHEIGRVLGLLLERYTDGDEAVNAGLQIPLRLLRRLRDDGRISDDPGLDPSEVATEGYRVLVRWHGATDAARGRMSRGPSNPTAPQSRARAAPARADDGKPNAPTSADELGVEQRGETPSRSVVEAELEALEREVARATQAGELEAAIAACRKLAAARGGDPRWLLKLGDLFQKNRDVREAIDAYFHVARRYQRSGLNLKAVAVFSTVRALVAARSPAFGARYDFLLPRMARLYEALRLESDATEAWEQRAEQLRRQGREEELIALSRRMLGRDPRNPIAHLRLAEALSRSQLIDDAIEAYAASAQLLVEADRLDDALKVYERLLRHRHVVRHVRAAAELYLQRGGPADAAAAISKVQIAIAEDPALATGPDALDLAMLAARGFRALGQTEKAEAFLREAEREAAQRRAEAEARARAREAHAVATTPATERSEAEAEAEPMLEVVVAPTRSESITPGFHTGGRGAFYRFSRGIVATPGVRGTRSIVAPATVRAASTLRVVSAGELFDRAEPRRIVDPLAVPSSDRRRFAAQVLGLKGAAIGDAEMAWTTVFAFQRKMAKCARYLVMPVASRTLVCDWVDRAAIASETLLTFATEHDAAFGLLQSRAHEAWWRGVGRASQQGDIRGRAYGASEFATFPLPRLSAAQLAVLAALSRALFVERKNAARALSRPVGWIWQHLDDGPASLASVRRARDELDRAVLDAYLMRHVRLSDEAAIFGGLLRRNMERESGRLPGSA